MIKINLLYVIKNNVFHEKNFKKWQGRGEKHIIISDFCDYFQCLTLLGETWVLLPAAFSLFDMMSAGLTYQRKPILTHSDGKIKALKAS